MKLIIISICIQFDIFVKDTYVKECCVSKDDQNLP